MAPAKSLHGFSLERPAAGKTGTTDDYLRRLVYRLHVPADHRRLGRLRQNPSPWGEVSPEEQFVHPSGNGSCDRLWANKPAVELFETRFSYICPDRFNDKAIWLLQTVRKNRKNFYIAGTQPTMYCPNHGGTQYCARSDGACSAAGKRSFSFHSIKQYMNDIIVTTTRLSIFS